MFRIKNATCLKVSIYYGASDKMRKKNRKLRGNLRVYYAELYITIKLFLKDFYLTVILVPLFMKHRVL